MKISKENIKNLFKKEINRDLLKITLVLIIYLIIFAIFKAGYDFQSVIPIKSKEEEKSISKNKSSYYLEINGQKKEILLSGDNSLFDLLNENKELRIDIVNYYEGKMISGINNSKNFKIYLNEKLVEKNLITKELDIIKPNSTIKITY